MRDSTTNDVLEPGEVLTLTQPSPRRRSFELRRGGAVIGSFEWRAARRSVATVAVKGLGSLELAARRRRLRVIRDGDELASVTSESGRDARIDVPGGRMRMLGPGRAHRWEVRDETGEVLAVRGFQGAARASVEITCGRAVGSETGLLQCVIAGFAALRDLQSGVDTGRAAAAVVATS